MGNVCALKDGDYIYEQNLPYLEVKYLRGKIEAIISDKGKFVKAGQMLILVDGENSGEIFYVPEDGYQGSTFKILTTINDDINNNTYGSFLPVLLPNFKFFHYSIAKKN